MANKKVKTKPLSKERFKEARKLQNMTLADLAAHSEIHRSEKTMLRWISKGEMPVELLDTIGRVLNIYPEFISGTLDHKAEEMESKPHALAALKAQFHAFDFPYIYKQKRELEPLQYIRNLLIANDIDPEQFDALAFKEQIEIYLELERSIHSILLKHFKPHHSSLHEYEIPMPPDDEIVSM